MNYYGYILADDVTNKELGTFLEKSIMQEYSDIIPIRGPKEYSENNWKYRIDIKGDLARFSGEEEILRDGKIVYKLFCFGGLLR